MTEKKSELTVKGGQSPDRGMGVEGRGKKTPKNQRKFCLWVGKSRYAKSRGGVRKLPKKVNYWQTTTKKKKDQKEMIWIKATLEGVLVQDTPAENERITLKAPRGGGEGGFRPERRSDSRGRKKRGGVAKRKNK